MTVDKKRKPVKGYVKVLLTIAIAAALLVGGAFTANAATDGDFFERISVIVNGEKVDANQYLKSHKTYTVDGEIADVYELELPENLTEDERSNSIAIEIEEDSEEGEHSYIFRSDGSEEFETEKAEAQE